MSLLFVQTLQGVLCLSGKTIEKTLRILQNDTVHNPVLSAELPIIPGKGCVYYSDLHVCSTQHFIITVLYLQHKSSNSYRCSNSPSFETGIFFTQLYSQFLNGFEHPSNLPSSCSAIEWLLSPNWVSFANRRDGLEKTQVWYFLSEATHMIGDWTWLVSPDQTPVFELVWSN